MRFATFMAASAMVGHLAVHVEAAQAQLSLRSVSQASAPADFDFSNTFNNMLKTFQQPDAQAKNFA